MKQFPYRSSLRAMSLVACGLVFTAGLAGAQSQEEMEHGNVWSRIIKHFDGKLTKCFKDPDKNRVIEEKYDENLVLMQKRLFQYDSKERLRNGVIMDAKGNALASTKYGYDSYDRINEERMYNAKGGLIQRKFPPGTLDGRLFPANAKYSLSFTVDPKNPTALGQMKATFDPIIQPTNNADDTFTPGVPLGSVQSGSSGLPAPAAVAAPVGRKPSMFPLKQR